MKLVWLLVACLLICVDFLICRVVTVSPPTSGEGKAGRAVGGWVGGWGDKGGGCGGGGRNGGCLGERGVRGGIREGL